MVTTSAATDTKDSSNPMSAPTSGTTIARAAAAAARARRPSTGRFASMAATTAAYMSRARWRRHGAARDLAVQQHRRDAGERCELLDVPGEKQPFGAREKPADADNGRTADDRKVEPRDRDDVRETGTRQHAPHLRSQRALVSDQDRGEESSCRLGGLSGDAGLDVAPQRRQGRPDGRFRGGDQRERVVVPDEHGDQNAAPGKRALEIVAARVAEVTRRAQAADGANAGADRPLASRVGDGDTEQAARHLLFARVTVPVHTQRQAERLAGALACNHHPFDRGRRGRHAMRDVIHRTASPPERASPPPSRAVRRRVRRIRSEPGRSIRPQPRAAGRRSPPSRRAPAARRRRWPGRRRRPRRSRTVRRHARSGARPPPPPTPRSATSGERGAVNALCARHLSRRGGNPAAIV